MNTAEGEKTNNRIAHAIARTVFLFGLLAWGYVVAMQLRHFNVVYDPLSEWLPIKLNYFGEASFKTIPRQFVYSIPSPISIKVV